MAVSQNSTTLPVTKRHTVKGTALSRITCIATRLFPAYKNIISLLLGMNMIRKFLLDKIFCSTKEKYFVCKNTFYPQYGILLSSIQYNKKISEKSALPNMVLYIDN